MVWFDWSSSDVADRKQQPADGLKEVPDDTSIASFSCSSKAVGSSQRDAEDADRKLRAQVMKSTAAQEAEGKAKETNGGEADAPDDMSIGSFSCSSAEVVDGGDQKVAAKETDISNRDGIRRRRFRTLNRYDVEHAPDWSTQKQCLQG